ncbi:ABC transporter ATP-binding protein [Polynucleobacter sp. AP-Latsch-80-C2]|jgi:iron complex transport system ATP-binding protein|uniref:ABC transporter ATP-binding protein n=1 Tax=Polynucleobacter sp. AP-Latsch-80-C2 TaxID=2576931 RepID=UPI001C0CD27C|nr:ABC transporter ATP-binding protein [Polynucleobacter sp. AP-Latsch-80-C2]MBU3622160.1 ABC transporter ATP-binding protein [Polynucleobacter sp. AP-Latsch-80-C2]
MKLQDLSVYRGPCEVLRNLSIEIPKGKWTSIVGPNGAGKSSLLQGITNILPIQGRISIDGIDIQTLSSKARARTIAWLAQNNDAAEEFSELTVYDTVMLGRIPHQGWLHLPSDRDHQVVQQVLIKTHTQSIATRYLHELSGGEKQRVLLARLLAVEAEILLMDEPLANLDPPHQADWLKWQSELLAQGKTLVTVLHEVQYALRADHIIMIGQGKLHFAGASNDPATQQALIALFEGRIRLEKLGNEWVSLPA